MRFELDEFDWLCGELEHADAQAMKAGMLISGYAPELWAAVLDFFVRWHAARAAEPKPIVVNVPSEQPARKAVHVYKLFLGPRTVKWCRSDS